MKGLKIGYVRVSSDDQNPERQLEAIVVEKIFVDRASGKDLNRPAFKSLLEFIRQGDTLIVHSMDRLARNLDDLRETVQFLVKKGIQVQFIKENLIFNGDDSPLSMLTLSIMGAFAEFERAILKERQREGIEIAKRKGLFKGGKGKRLTPAQIEELKMRASQGQSKPFLARHFNLSPRAIYNYLGDQHGKKLHATSPKS